MDTAKLGHVHAHMKYLQVDGESYVLPEKAYKNLAWLNSHGAKPIRILAEFMEPEQRFEACNVKNTILFFGSARARSPADHELATKRAEEALADPAITSENKHKQEIILQRLKKTAWMCDVYIKVEDLARRLTEWSMGRISVEGRVPYIVSTGGGPGLMEAANKGAASVPGAVTAGIAISLPFEAGLNKFVTPELGFQMHYFFSRKFALCWPSRALIVCAGGYGSLDECFEILTLMQSGKIEMPHLLPVVMFPGSYWKKIIDWEEMVADGVISENDVKMLYFTDDVHDAYEHIVSKLLQWEAASAVAAAAAAEAAKKAAISAAAAANASAVQAALALRGIRPAMHEDYAPSPVITAETMRFAAAHTVAPGHASTIAPSPVIPTETGAGAIGAPVCNTADVTGLIETPPATNSVVTSPVHTDPHHQVYMKVAKAPGLARELSHE